jgi:hypothetical protein
MAICHEMNEGDVFFGTGEDACSVPLQCCGQDMTKK